MIFTPPESQEYDPNADEIIFKCEASTDDSTELAITWFFNEAIIYFNQEKRMALGPDNSLIIDVRDMDRDEVKRQFSGEYMCLADNGVSTDEQGASLRVGSGGGAGKFHGKFFLMIYCIYCPQLSPKVTMLLNISQEIQGITTCLIHPSNYFLTFPLCV